MGHKIPILYGGIGLKVSPQDLPPAEGNEPTCAECLHRLQ